MIITVLIIIIYITSHIYCSPDFYYVCQLTLMVYGINVIDVIAIIYNIHFFKHLCSRSLINLIVPFNRQKIKTLHILTLLFSTVINK